MWECGLKHRQMPGTGLRVRVTPYVGVWIETSQLVTCGPTIAVTPYVGVWIETGYYEMQDVFDVSLLMWECGLKQP